MDEKCAVVYKISEKKESSCISVNEGGRKCGEQL